MISKHPKTLLGKNVLVAIIHVTDVGQIVSQEQFLATIVKADENILSIVKRDSNISSFSYAPELLQLAPRGKYILTSSGEEVLDPDYTIQWAVYGKQLPDGAFTARPIHPDPHVSGFPHQWKFTYRYDQDYIQHMIQEFGSEYIGKSVIIGVTNVESGNQRQLFGNIESVAGKGITVILSSGVKHYLPPDLTLLISAPPGEYRLRSTGEVITNPDFLAYWEVSNSKSEKKNISSGA